MDDTTGLGRRELWLGLYGGLVLNLGVAALCNNNPWFSFNSAQWLVTLAMVNELYGVLLVASPELLPLLRQLLVFLDTKGRRAARWLVAHGARLLGLPRSQTVHVRGAVDTAAAMDVSVSGIVKPGEGLTTEERVDFLVRQNEELQKRLNSVEADVQKLPARWREEIQDARADLLDSQAALERRIARNRIQLRLLGVSFVVVGLMLAWSGNLASIN